MQGIGTLYNLIQLSKFVPFLAFSQRRPILFFLLQKNEGGKIPRYICTADRRLLKTKTSSTEEKPQKKFPSPGNNWQMHSTSMFFRRGHFPLFFANFPVRIFQLKKVFRFPNYIRRVRTGKTKNIYPPIAQRKRERERLRKKRWNHYLSIHA